ncbi:MAG: hypothetical protein JXR77_15470, partial [Lentisphaeria bacterium]|nr:hypothetical protein [Lentisphaeria bacterium]
LPGSALPLVLTVDSTDTVAEAIEGNNTANASLPVAAAGDAFEAEQAAAGFADLGTVRGTTLQPGLSLDSAVDRDLFRFRLAADAAADDEIRLTWAEAPGTVEAVLIARGNPSAPKRSVPKDGICTIALAGHAAGTYDLLLSGGGNGLADYTLAIDAPDAAGANLTIADVTPATSAVDPGGTMSAEATFANNGTAAAPASQASYYLSADPRIAPAEDLPLGTAAIAALGAGEACLDAPILAIPADTAPGWYYLGAVADSAAAVAESAETDNTLATPIAVLPGADALEPNNHAAQASAVSLAAGVWEQAGLTLRPGDEDWFAFELTGTGSATQKAAVTFAPDEGPVLLELHGDSGTPVARREAHNGHAEILLQGLPAGAYSLRVTAAGGGFQSAYALTIGSPALRTAPASFCRADDSGSGSTPEGAGGANHPAPGSRTAQLLRQAAALWAEALGESLDLRLTYEYADLPRGHLAAAQTGLTTPGSPVCGHIILDTDADGRGWFAPALTARDADPAAAPTQGRYDLLSILCHELGHILGFQAERAPGAADVSALTQLAADGEHLDPRQCPGSVMAAKLPPGTRRLPSRLEGDVLRALRGTAAPTCNGGSRQAEGTAARTAAAAPTIAVASRRQYAQAKATGLGFVLLADDPIPEPLPEGLVNGDFAVQDPGAPGFGWLTNGPVEVDGGQARLDGSGILFTDLSQAFATAPETRTLTVTIQADFGPATAPGALPRSFEIALLRQDDATPLTPTVEDLGDTDCLLSLQQDGTLWLAPGIDLVQSRPVPSGTVVPLGRPLTFVIALPALDAGTGVRLFFDLLANGHAASTATVEGVALVAKEAHVLRLGRGWNAFALPLQLDAPGVADVLDGVPFARAVWTFSTADGRYLPVDQILPGHGYFVLAEQAAVKVLYGTRPAANWDHLIPGWNLIGSPDGTWPPDAVGPGTPGIWWLDTRGSAGRQQPGETLDPERPYWFHRDAP